MPELTIKRPGSLLSIERRTITEEQAARVLALVDTDEPDFLERINREIDASPFTHPDSEWARERREGVR